MAEQEQDQYILDISELTDEQKSQLKELLKDFATGAGALQSEVEGFAIGSLSGFDIRPTSYTLPGLKPTLGGTGLVSGGHTSHRDSDGWF